LEVGLVKEVRAMMLPEPFRFLRIGWWVVHIIGISLVFYLGSKFGGAIFG
jgi:hypothetical protein